MTQYRSILSVVVIAVCSICVNISFAAEPIYSANNVAIKGYDVVAYFIDEKAIKGQPEYSYHWRGLDWHFASQQHRDLFIRSPENYQPMFGGFCGLGAAHGALVPSDPEAWTIHKGKLVLNQDREVTTTWRYNPDINIQRAELSYDNAISRYMERQSKLKAQQSNKQPSHLGEEK